MKALEEASTKNRTMTATGNVFVIGDHDL